MEKRKRSTSDIYFYIILYHNSSYDVCLKCVRVVKVSKRNDWRTIKIHKWLTERKSLWNLVRICQKVKLTKAQPFFEIWSTDFNRKETERAKKQWRRNVALSSYYWPLSLSLFVFLVFLRNKIFIHTHTGSIAKPTFSFNKVTSNRNSYRPPPQRTWRSWSIPLHQTSLTR